MRVEAPQKLCSSGLFSDEGVGKVELRAAFFAFFKFSFCTMFQQQQKVPKICFTLHRHKKIKAEMLV